MDLRNPLRSFAPTVDADVLSVLVGTHASLTGVRVQQLAGRSYAQVRAVLHRLVSDGLVEAERHGNTVSYSLNRAHVLAGPIEAAAASAGAEVERRLRSLVGPWSQPPVAVVVFGSFARRDGGVDSDIDILLVRADDVNAEDAEWAAGRYDLAQQVERWTGNAAQIVEVSVAELTVAATRGGALFESIRREGRVAMGADVRVMVDAARRRRHEPEG